MRVADLFTALVCWLWPGGKGDAEESTQPWIFNMEVDCIPLAGASSCNATLPAHQCSVGRPYEMVFLYNGGNCDQSVNVQEALGESTCQDFGSGPPTERGEKSFVVVSALGDDDIVYHNDWVEVGGLFIVSADSGGNNFAVDQLVTIYGDSNTADPANILQSVKYSTGSSGSENLYLKDRFGAVELVMMTDEVQEGISCVKDQNFDLDITIPLDYQGGPATVQSLTVASNVHPYFFDRTDTVSGINKT